MLAVSTRLVVTHCCLDCGTPLCKPFCVASVGSAFPWLRAIGDREDACVRNRGVSLVSGISGAFRECPTRVPYKNVLRVSHKNALQCPTTTTRVSSQLSCKCQARVFFAKGVTRVSFKCVLQQYPQRCPARVSHNTVLQERPCKSVACCT